jgi:hypothetical protein
VRLLHGGIAGGEVRLVMKDIVVRLKRQDSKQAEPASRAESINRLSVPSQFSVFSSCCYKW